MMVLFDIFTDKGINMSDLKFEMELDNGIEPNSSIEYINILGIDTVHKVPRYAIVTNVRRHITPEGNKCGYNFDYNGKTHYVYYPWALVENTETNKIILAEMDRLDYMVAEIKAELKSHRMTLADLRNIKGN